MEVSNAQKINEKYYNKLYRKKNILVGIFYPYISFDQQSKSKANFSFIKKILKKESRILDFGFGHGSFLLKFPKQSQLYGVEISEEAVNNFPKIAKILGKHIYTCTPANISNTIALGSLDVICLSHVLEHVDDDRAILNQLSRFLSKNGYLLINVPINEVWKDPKHVRIYDLETVNELLTKTDFCIIDYLAVDKITAYLLKQEYNKKPSWLRRFFLRSLRLMLSFAPVGTYRFLDASIFKKYSNQQLLVLAKKA